MKMVPLDIVDGSYKDEDLSFSAQDTVNYLPTSAEQGGTRTPTLLRTPPGLKPAVLIGINAGEGGMQVAGPVRGTYNAEGRFFAVAGNTLFQITTGNVSVPLGTVPGVGRVSFSHNQITNGNEILVNNGNSGYIYNTVTQVFQRITDTSYPGGLQAVFINNRFVQIEPSRRYLFNSDLADGLSYNALDRFTSETSPDLVMSIHSIGNQLAVFSSTTTEWFEDTGANPQPFRSTGIVADKGAAGPFCTAKMDNQLFFLADDGVFYRYQGYNPVRISTKPIEQAIRGKNWFNCFTTVWEDSGYAVCYWTFPDGQTWGYDASTGKWHRRESYGFNRWRVNSLTYWRNAWYGGDFQAGKLYQLDWDYILEGDQEFESIRAAGAISDNQNRVIHERLELVMNTGMVETMPVAFVDQPNGPDVSGEAPNGSVGSPYSFSYTTTPGSAPIARTILIGTTLPAGWEWNQATATLSNDNVTETGSLTITMRTYDANGLFAEHEDTINIQNVLIILGDISGAQKYCRAQDSAAWGAANDLPFMVGGASFGVGIPGRGLVWGPTQLSKTDDYGISWTVTGASLGGSGGPRWGAYRDGLLLIGGASSGIYMSTDGGDTTTLLPSPANPQSNYIQFIGERVIVARLNGVQLSYSDSPNSDFVSNTVSWSAGGSYTLTTSSGACSRNINGVFVLGGSSAAVNGKPRLVYTENGIDLTTRTLSTASDATIVHADGGFVNGEEIWVIGCSSGERYWSTDRFATYALCTGATAGGLDAGIFDGVRFVSGGYPTGIAAAYSDDGKVFVNCTQPFSSNIKLMIRIPGE